MIIDTHTHIWPEKAAESAQVSLEGLFKIQFVDKPVLPVLERYMKKNNVDVSVVCAVAIKPEQVPSINDWLFSIKSKSIKVFCAMHPAYDKLEQEMQRIKKFGDGIKVQPEFQNFFVDDENVFRLYEQVVHNGLPILFHAGEELSGTMQVRSSPQRLLSVKKHFPKLVMIAAHFGGFRLTDEVEKFLLGKDIYMDTSFFFDYIAPERARKLILSHRSDRLLFGSDFPLIDPIQDIHCIENLDIPASLKEKIFSGNAANLLAL